MIGNPVQSSKGRKIYGQKSAGRIVQRPRESGSSPRTEGFIAARAERAASRTPGIAGPKATKAAERRTRGKNPMLSGVDPQNFKRILPDETEPATHTV